MNDSDEKVSAAIAEQAGERFVANDEGPLDARESAALTAWLKASPVHVGEFLGVSVIARDLRELRNDPEYSLDAILKRVRVEEYLGVALVAHQLREAADDPEMPLEAILERVRQADVETLPTPAAAASPQRTMAGRARPAVRWRFAAVAASLAVIVGTLFWWSGDRAVPERYATSHGELRSWRLSDNSVLRLNTDTAVTVRYARAERVVELDHGQVFFEVTHEPARRFRVIAGTAEVVAVGTQFDVYCQGSSTVITVTQGAVEVGAAVSAKSNEPRPIVRVSAGEQVRVTAGALSAGPAPADVQRSTAWLRRQIVFEREPLAAVATEFNRYAALPIEIETPAVRTLLISGVFTAGDTDTFIAFLRTLDGVTVETTPTRIRVLQLSTATPEGPAPTR